MQQKSDTDLQIGLSHEQRTQMVESLNRLLANEYLLYTKTLHYHWNVTGPLFGPLHEFFEKQYLILFGFIDHIAERIRALGFYPYGTMQEFLAHTTLQEGVQSNIAEQEMLKTLLTDHETIIRQLRPIITLSAEINDMGSNNFLSDLIEKHEKMAWMLRAQLI